MSGGVAEGRPLRADARRNRERVLAAARAVLSEQGLDAPIAVIAQRARVGVGTVYRHFPTREALYRAVVVEGFERVAQSAFGPDAERDPGEAFYAFMAGLVEEGVRNAALGEALERTGYDLDSARPEGRFAGGLANLLARAQAAGAVRSDVSVDDVLALLATCCATGAREDDAAAARRRLAIVADGLQPGV
ncbi:MAG: TetR/AcrR family transcriptional regulator [Actinobacteria bacterium]|nr:TetR/AcrR family transcriptional regulator [Actinomycetota bacterium]